MNAPNRNGIYILSKKKIIDDIEAGESHHPVTQRYNLKNLSMRQELLTIKNKSNHLFYQIYFLLENPDKFFKINSSKLIKLDVVK